MDLDEKFLYGVVAVQAGLIGPERLDGFIAACDNTPDDTTKGFSDFLVNSGWIQARDKAHLDYLVQRKLEQHAGNAKATLADGATHLKRSLAALHNSQLARLMAAAFATPQDTQKPLNTQRYSVTRLHATGGIGRVWLARDKQLGRDVALKELRPEQAHNAAQWARFLREAQITGQLEHPGIVPVYEVAEHPETGQPFYTMRFVSGRTLSDAAREYHRQRRAGDVQWQRFQELLNAFVHVCKTIAYAHARGVIHRDLKGENVIIGDFGEVVVLDWGLARTGDSPVDDQRDEKPKPALAGAGVDLTLDGQMLGTPSYMAPEQAEGRRDLIDHRTDIYGLGALLYEVLTGEPPYTGTDLAEVLAKIKADQPIPPHSLWAGVPDMLESACLRALAKEREARHASATDLAREVEQWQEVQRQQAIEALRTSQALYHSLVENIPICVWRKDTEGRFTFANTGFLQKFKLAASQLLGKTDYDIFPADLALKYHTDDTHVMKTGQSLHMTEEQISPSGTRIVVDVIKIPVYDAHGAIAGTQGVLWDVTAIKRDSQ